MVDHAVILAISNPQHRSRLTYNRAHAMLPALGKPLVARIMDRLHRIGIRQYTVIIGADEGAVASYLNKQWMPDVDIDLVTKSGYNTLPHIFQEIAKTHHHPFIVCSYNCFTHNHYPESLLKHHQDHPNKLILTATSKSLSRSKQQHYAVMEDHIIKRVTNVPVKDEYTLGLCDFAICGQDVVTYLADLHLPEPTSNNSVWKFLDIAGKYIKDGGQGMISETAWTLQIEADYDLLTLTKHLLNEGSDAHILSEIPYTVQITPPVRIDPQVSVGQGAKIGPNVYLERGSSVGHDVTLRDSIILSRTSIPAGKSASNTIITTRGPISADSA